MAAELVHRGYEVLDAYWIGDRAAAAGGRVLVSWELPKLTRWFPDWAETMWELAQEEALDA